MTDMTNHKYAFSEKFIIFNLLYYGIMQYIKNTVFQKVTHYTDFPIAPIIPYCSPTMTYL